MTQNNQTSTLKQNQDKEQYAREQNDQIEKEQKQNQIDKQHNQAYQEDLEAQNSNTDEKSEAKQSAQPND